MDTNTNYRLRDVRKAVGLTQIEFGKKTGISQGHLTAMESGKRAITDKTIKVICLEFGVSETWLRTGVGEMFEPTTGKSLDALAEKYKLAPVDKKIVELYMSLPETHKELFRNFIVSLAAVVTQQPNTTVAGFQEAYAAGVGGLDTDPEIEAQVQAYREELELEKASGGKLSATEEVG